jgi:hypothetical protein
MSFKIKSSKKAQQMRSYKIHISAQIFQNSHI